jgi:uncharacterized protein
MSDELLERFTRQYLQSQTMSQTLFTWHGGEPLMRNIGFYRKALRMQKTYGGGRQIDNSLQTNGTLLTDEWCRFFTENRFLVGISVDGPEHCHDRYRKMADGRGSFADVMRGIDLLRKHGVEYNVMTTVNDYNVRYPEECYRFLKDVGSRYIQFTPVVERTEEGGVAPWTVDAEAWGDFLIAVFDRWVREDVGRYFVQYFDATLANWMGHRPGTCILAPRCGHAGVMEFNGDVYSCDHFVHPAHRLGNLHRETLAAMMYSPRQMRFGDGKRDALPARCLECRYRFACHGECPKNRSVARPGLAPGVNYLCEGYRKFFRHVSPYMDFMKGELLASRPPANIMYHFVPSRHNKSLNL